MGIYLGIAAVRIQPWLLRMPRLRLMRGASNALRTCTQAQNVTAILANVELTGVEVEADETGDIDGVVALRGIPTLDDAPKVAAQVLRELSHALPGVEWDAWWCEAGNYPSAAAQAASSAAGVGRLRWSPATTEFTLARPCVCRREMGTRTITDFDNDERVELFVGEDCYARWNAFDAQRGALDTNASPSEAAEHSKNSDVATIPGAWARDFDTLARRGGLAPGRPTEAIGRRESRNHLATVVADANAMGALFGYLQDAPPDVPVGSFSKTLSTAVDEACTNAVLAAARAVSHPDAEVMVAAPHFIGGDDIFVTVPAAVGWFFADNLVREFATRVEGLGGKVPESSMDPAWTQTVRKKIGTLGISVGVCFSHSTHPVSDCHERAEAALKAAKKAGRGAVEVVGWTDLTADTTSPPYTIRAGAVADQLVAGAEGNWSGLPDVFRLRASARATLTSHLRDRTAEGLEAELEFWARRVGWNREGLVTSLQDLAATLSRARWWPIPDVAEEEQ